jgi:hypothetical protein
MIVINKSKPNPCIKCEDDAKHLILTVNGPVNACICKRKEQYDGMYSNSSPYSGWKSITEFENYMKGK